MATYKQRTPFQRPATTYSDDEDPHTLLASGSTKHVSTAHSTAPATHHHNSHHPQHQTSSAYEDDIVENTSDREWTSIRNSTASTRARQLQYQQQQQQQRTREWQFVLAQHHRPSLLPSGPTTSREISSDEYDDILSGTDAPSAATSPRVAAAAPNKTGAIGAGEHASFFGYSDLTSDGLESVGESEDLGVWSHDDEDAQSLAMSKPAAPRRSSVLATSSTTSLSHIPRPSFAASPDSTRDVDSKFQNQMPFHDGSGNFAGALSLRSNLESDMEASDRGWESSSSRASSMLRRYDSKAGHVRSKICSSEFKTVIQNIADLQHTNSRQARPQRSRPRSVDGYSITSTNSQQPLFTYPNVVTRRPIFNIYESEMEDMADMVMEVPAKLGWMQTFEHVLRVLDPNEYAFHVSDPTLINPIKALAQHLTPEEPATMPTMEGPSSVSENNTTDDKAQSILESESASQLEVQQVKQNMAAASLETMKRLQTRVRSNSHHRRASDLMQVDFSPTVRDRPTFENALQRDRRVISRSTGTSTSSNVRDTNMITVVISTLRRFQNHVKSNLLHADFYDEDRHADLTKSLGFDGDLGIEWSTSALATEMERAAESGERPSPSATRERRERPFERTSSFVSSVSRSSSQQSVRRVNSDCGLESMRHYKNKDPIHSSRHRTSLVEYLVE